ncbi:MAG: MYG1 family protein [Chlamydiae bacterium]|nr:MYG1 family protein [Chlamydiota bacterium]
MAVPRSFGTHDGTFHADEVTACALLLCYKCIDKDKVVRSRRKELLEQCEYVCDVGGEYSPEHKRFDHHQASYQGERSSAGMVWSYLREQGKVDRFFYSFLQHTLIQGVDAHDNGKISQEPGVCTFSQMISNFVPIHYDAGEEEQNRAFFQAVDFVVGHLQRTIDRFLYTEQCKEKVRQAMSLHKEYLLFEESLPWMDAFFSLRGEEHPAQFVIMPSNGHWKLRGIPPSSEDRMQVRVPLPKEWAGLLEEELQTVSGIPGAIFCHKGRFISVWKTKEDVMNALAYVLEGERV